jgi:hypothetical protein
VYLKDSSNKGNPVYNQNLSLQRTENVKKYLVKKGIHPSRILTQYHGIMAPLKKSLHVESNYPLLSESSFGSHHIFKIDIRYKILKSIVIIDMNYKPDFTRSNPFLNAHEKRTKTTDNFLLSR